MGVAVNLNVNGKIVPSIQITYEDLIILYEMFIEKYSKVPTTKEMTSKYNLPQQRIVNRILKENNITYNDFLNMFGKFSHVRTKDTSMYDKYVEKFKLTSLKLRRTLAINDLINNTYGLPSAQWLVNNCPDKNVKTYVDFCHWCGLEDNRLKLDKKYVSQSLISLEKKLKRPITSNDINVGSVGFSMIVVTRIWGGLNKCKEELGLTTTPGKQPLPFEYYKDKLDFALSNLSDKYITWKDIEKYGAEHKGVTQAFKRKNLDVFQYIREQGFEMNPNNFSFYQLFDNGEKGSFYSRI